MSNYVIRSFACKASSRDALQTDSTTSLLFKEVVGDATRAYKQYTATYGDSKGSLMNFFENYLEKKHAKEGDAFTITITTPKKNNKEKPYKWSGNKLIGEREHARAFLLVDSEDHSHILEQINTTVGPEYKVTKDIQYKHIPTRKQAIARAKALVKSIQRSVTILEVRTFISDDQGIVGEAAYAPGKNSAEGVFIVFGYVRQNLASENTFIQSRE